jgi:hypothetical protein
VAGDVALSVAAGSWWAGCYAEIRTTAGRRSVRGQTLKGATVTEKIEGYVSAVWKWIAMVAIGILIGGAPGYLNLLIGEHQQLTRADVDSEVSAKVAPLVQQVSDMKDSLNVMTGQLNELIQTEQQNGKKHQ